MKNTCSNEMLKAEPYKCGDDINTIQQLFGNICNEAAVRLAHKGVFPIAATGDLGNQKIYFKDFNGLIIGTSNKDESLLSQTPKPNKRLTKIERNQLKLMGLLK